MTYETTGEVRPPRVGEYYIAWDAPEREWSRKVRLCDRETCEVRVIMRPVDTSTLERKRQCVAETLAITGGEWYYAQDVETSDSLWAWIWGAMLAFIAVCAWLAWRMYP